MNLKEPINRALVGIVPYFSPMIVQTRVLNAMVDQKSVIVKWLGGTGKTWGMILALLKVVDFDDGHCLQGLILVPTELLAVQVYNTIVQLIVHIPNNSKITMKSCEFNENCILITTPERAVANSIDVSKLKFLGIDEMDCMLEFGTNHRKGIKSILNELPNQAKILCIGSQLPQLNWFQFDDHLKESLIINFAEHPEEPEILECTRYEHVYCKTIQTKIDRVSEILYNNDWCYSGCIVFCNSQPNVEKASELFQHVLPNHLVITPTLLKDPTNCFERMKNSKYFISTDDCWLGIDMPDIDVVVHFDIICNRERLLMRSTRCGRPGRRSHSLLLCSTEEENNFVQKFLETGGAIIDHPCPVCERVPLISNEHLWDTLIVTTRDNEQ